MKNEVSIKIIVKEPLAGVVMMVQKGKDELLAPVEATGEKLVFEFEMTADLSGDAPNFLGKFAQGPKDQRFIYVNSGSYAGQKGTCWDRRAKISLMPVTREQVEEVVASGGKLEGEIPGVGRDGGPVCASTPVIGGWRVVRI